MVWAKCNLFFKLQGPEWVYVFLALWGGTKGSGGEADLQKQLLMVALFLFKLPLPNPTRTSRPQGLH